MSSDHIRWKTDAWKNPAMVAGYDRSVSSAVGKTLLKNRIETGIFQRNVQSADVLDIGIGTGRASLPLARAGKAVTGVDSSQAMLDKCRELAGETPVTLQLGDVARLPFADGTFGAAMGLNTLGHFPHWQEIIREWRRVVRPGGEILFDILSLDHDIAFARATGHDEAYGVAHFAPTLVSNFQSRLRVHDLVTYATGLGLRVRRMVPYSVLFGSAGYNRFFTGTLLEGHSWDRLLSWVAQDERLFDFIAFLEEEIVAHLPTTVACRYVAVFDVVEGTAENELWLERNRRFSEAVTAGISPTLLEQYAEIDIGKVKASLNSHLEYEPNRFVLARIMLANRKWNWDLHLDDWVDERFLPQLRHVLTLGALDDVTLGLIRSLGISQAVANAFSYKGVPLDQACDYDMMTSILDEGCEAFEVPFSGPPL